MDTNTYTNVTLDEHDKRAPKRVAVTVHNAIERTANAALHVVDRAGPATDRWIDAVRRHTMESPLTALAIAIAVGFVLGRII